MPQKKRKTIRRLAVIILGNPNSGKSSVWQYLFDQKKLAPRDPNNLKWVCLTEKKHPGNYSKWIEASLIYSSCTERGKKLKDRLPRPLPDIVLCSAQYHQDEIPTFNFFHQNGYDIKVLLLNPGANCPLINTKSTIPNFVDLVLNQYEGSLIIRPGGSGGTHRQSRLNAGLVREMILGWLEA